MNKKAMVIGLARSGIAVTKLLLLRGYEVYACDSKEKEKFEGALDEIEKMGAHLILSEKEPQNHLAGMDCLIVSPGIPLTHPVFAAAKELGVEVMGEIEYAYRESTGMLLALTGTTCLMFMISLVCYLKGVG